jgi:hypothetical protein
MEINPLGDALVELREVSQTRLSRESYLELLINEHTRIMANILVMYAGVKPEDLYDFTNARINELTEQIRSSVSEKPTKLWN